MTLDQFVAQNNGRFVDVDHVYGAQCWDLVELYAEQVLNVPREPWAITLGPQGAAKEAWTVFDSHMQHYFDKIPRGQQQPGDINVYDGHGVYTEGHINIQGNSGLVFEQNADPDNSPSHIANRLETYLLGSLRLKGGSQGDTIMEPADYRTNDGDVVNFYVSLLGRQPSPEEIKIYTGRPFKEVISGFTSSPEFKARVDSGLKPTKLMPGVYQV